MHILNSCTVQQEIRNPFWPLSLSVVYLNQPKYLTDETEAQNLLIQARPSTLEHTSHAQLSEDPDWLHSISAVVLSVQAALSIHQHHLIHLNIYYATT